MPGTVTTTRPILLNFRVSEDEKRAIALRAALGSQDVSTAVRSLVLAWAWGTTNNGR
jgi:hypothetical protein